ncbi:transcriptional regulator [Pedobacter yulinensis]|uniref:Transcriptional regulator n=1 Tax=Pedobacter yulinensis TaxID=2126353 RepID=A0A2T3HLC8_9SPHI|nr:metalloregulator ArsR/SmtB family transcription factor [Pedobacter yulinensis]PST83234.1 transcriptional regulator [Pedobacter yulinensis]
MDLRRDTFQAIADPTRRQIIELLTRKPSLPVNAIAEQFEVTRQAVSLHVRILHECGLIAIRKQGRERYCEVNLDRLDEVSDWINYNRKFWKEKFRSLDNYLKNQNEKNNDHEQI